MGVPGPTNWHYPDVDDTAVVETPAASQWRSKHVEAIERARMDHRHAVVRRWPGVFEPEKHAPLSNSNTICRPWGVAHLPTAYVTARCASFLAQIGMAADDPVLVRALGFRVAQQV